MLSVDVPYGLPQIDKNIKNKFQRKKFQIEKQNYFAAIQLLHSIIPFAVTNNHCTKEKLYTY